MISIGVTGGLGTGKSTVVRMFGELGAEVMDADAIAHEVMEPKRVAWRRIVKRFGEGVLLEDQTIDRRRLAAVVFNDAGARRELEAIIHPQVLQEIQRRLGQWKRRRVKAAVVEVPLLFETQSQGMVDAVVVVTAPPEAQRQRLLKKGFEPDDVDKRIAAQASQSAKAALADYQVDNAGSIEQTRRQVRDVWHRLVEASSKRRGSTSRH